MAGSRASAGCCPQPRQSWRGGTWFETGLTVISRQLGAAVEANGAHERRTGEINDQRSAICLSMNRRSLRRAIAFPSNVRAITNKPVTLGQRRGRTGKVAGLRNGRRGSWDFVRWSRA